MIISLKDTLFQYCIIKIDKSFVSSESSQYANLNKLIQKMLDQIVQNYKISVLLFIVLNFEKSK